MEALQKELDAAKASQQGELEAARAAVAEIEKRVRDGFSNIVYTVRNSSSQYRMVAAREFLRSRTYQELLVKATLEEGKQAVKTAFGQLKTAKHLPLDLDAEKVIHLGLDENFKEPAFDPADDDTRVLEEDAFYELCEFDPKSTAEGDSLQEELAKIQNLAENEIRWVQTGQWESDKSEESPTPPLQ